MESKELPTRDGVGGAPVRMTEEEVELLTKTLEEHAYQGSIRGVSGRQNRESGANEEANCGLP